jgi:hypothetical protein
MTSSDYDQLENACQLGRSGSITARYKDGWISSCKGYLHQASDFKATSSQFKKKTQTTRKCSQEPSPPSRPSSPLSSLFPPPPQSLCRLCRPATRQRFTTSPTAFPQAPSTPVPRSITTGTQQRLPMARPPMMSVSSTARPALTMKIQLGPLPSHSSSTSKSGTMRIPPLLARSLVTPPAAPLPDP